MRERGEEGGARRGRSEKREEREEGGARRGRSEKREGREEILIVSQVTIMNGIGCVVAIIGILWYNSIEYQIKEEKRRKSMMATEKEQEKLVKETELESVVTDKTDD